MIQTIKYNAQFKKQWDDFLKTTKNFHFMFHRDYMEYHSDRFTDHSLLFFKDNKLIALFPCNSQPHTLYSHQGLTFGGFLVDRHMSVTLMLSCFEELTKHARANGFSKLFYKAIPSFYHNAPCQEDIYALFRSGAALYRVDVSSTIDYHSQLPITESRKSGIRKAKRNGLEIKKSSDYPSFMAILEDLLKHKYETVPTHTAQEMLLLEGRFPENIKLFGVYYDGKMEAGAVVFETEVAAHSKYMATTVKGRSLGALDLLLDHLINQVYKPNKRYFDFGISTEDDGKYLNTNLIFQKEHFGGRGIIHEFYELNL